MSVSNRPTPNSSGFTLMELLLVLTILTVIVAMAWPAMYRSFEEAQFRDAGKQVRIELAKARLAAIKAGSTRVFRFRGGTGEFTVSGIDSSEADDVATLPETSIDSNPESQFLPHGVRFEGQKTTDALADELTDDPLTGSTSTTTATDGWSAPIVFFANGRTSTVRIRLVDHRGYRLDVTLRGLTGSARVGRPMKPDAPEVKDDPITEDFPLATEDFS